MGIGTGLLMLTFFGCSLIWKGVTGDVMTTRMGDRIIPCWMYIFSGVVLLAFPASWVVLQTDVGRQFLGL